MAQAELSKELLIILMAAQKQARQNGDAYVGTDTLIRALKDNKEIASALTEAGESTFQMPLLFLSLNPQSAELSRLLLSAAIGLPRPTLKSRCHDVKTTMAPITLLIPD